MPLIRNCPFANPSGAVMPAAPVPAAAPNLAPNQGDHVFGDVIGAIGTALQLIFGGGATWETRMRNYNSTMATVWSGFNSIDLGHGANPPIVNRQGPAEPDQHSHMFGGYSNRLQWKLCEIACTGFAHGEVRSVGGYNNAWKNNVLAGFDDLMNHLVDSTALNFYITSPNAIRNAVLGSGVQHTAISLVTANANPAMGPGRARISNVLASYNSLRNQFYGLLERFNTSTRTLNTATGLWT